MEYTNLVTASRVEESDYSENVCETEEVNEVNKINGHIVTTVNGTTKPLLDKNNWQCEDKSKNVIRDSHRNNFKCAPPFYNIRHKKLQKKLMNKSSEILLETSKSYKHVTVGKHTRVSQSFQTTKKIVKSNEFCQRKGIQRFHFMSIREEIPMPFFKSDGQSNAKIKKEEIIMTLEEIESKNQINKDSGPKTKKIRKAISSEDFVQNVIFKKRF